MSNLIFYVLYDVVAKSIARTFLFKNPELCLRFLKQNFTQLGPNVKDYKLYEIGEIDEETLTINNTIPIEIPPRESFQMLEQQIACKEFENIKEEFFKIQKERMKNEDKISNARE